MVAEKLKLLRDRRRMELRERQHISEAFSAITTKNLLDSNLPTSSTSILLAFTYSPRALLKAKELSLDQDEVFEVAQKIQLRN